MSKYYIPKHKVVKCGEFYVDKRNDMFCAYSDGRCTFNVYLYYAGLKPQSIVSNLEEPTIEEPLRVFLEGCDDTIYVKRFSGVKDSLYQKLMGVLQSNIVLDSKRLIKEFDLVCFN